MAVVRKLVPGIFRAAALLLLLLTGVDLAVCDAGANPSCDLGSTSNPDRPDQDDCFCCCTHVIVPTAPVVSVSAPVAFAETETPAAPPTVDSAPIYHPPKA